MTATPSSNPPDPSQSKVTAAGGGTFTTLPTHEEIARRAHEIYLASGCVEGRSEQNWLQAERELLTEAVTLVEGSQPKPEPAESATQQSDRFAPAFRSPRLRFTGSTG